MFPTALFNTLLGVEGAEMALKVGRTLGLDKPGLGGRIMGKLQAAKAGALPAGAEAVGAAGRLVGGAAEGFGPNLMTGLDKAGKGLGWARGKGTTAWNAFKGSPRAQHIAAAGGMAAFGYATSNDDASTAQKLGRAAAFGFVGHKGYQAFSSKANRALMGQGLTAFGNKEWKQGAELFSKGLGTPTKWGMAQSIKAGAFYGALSSNATILGGATAGAAIDFGIGRRRTAPMEGLALSTETKGRGLLGLYAGTARGVRNGYAKGGLVGAFRAAPLIKTGMYFGAAKGAYNNMQEGDNLGVLTGAIGGGLKGAALGGAVRFGTSHPFVAIGGFGAYSAANEGIRGGINQVMSTGAPGFDTMNADGDLALALHKMRHG